MFTSFRTVMKKRVKPGSEKTYGYCGLVDGYVRTGPGRYLENSCCNGACDGKFPYLLAELFLQDLLLFLTETQPEDTELVQRPLREINLAKLKTDLLFDFIYLLLGELQFYNLLHGTYPP